MNERFHTIEAAGVRLMLDLHVGHIRAFEVERAGRTIAPLHTAPWVDDPAISADPTIPPTLKYLSGDFFCAPFAKSDVEEAPAHGWPANSRWNLVGVDRSAGTTRARYELAKRVMGRASSRKSLSATITLSLTSATSSKAEPARFRSPATR